MIYEAREALEEAKLICRNKHATAATGSQQPCDLSPVFCLLRQLQKMTTTKYDVACGLSEDIHELFAVHLRAKGLNLDENCRKKRALIDFLLSVPELLEAVLKKKHIVNSFVEADIIDEETKMFPDFDKLIGTCKRWVSILKDIRMPKRLKEHCIRQFQHLMKLQLAHAHITCPDMKAVTIPLGK